MRRELSEDYAACSNEMCPLKERCFRRNVGSGNPRQVYGSFEWKLGKGGPKCEGFIDAEDEG